MNDYTTLGEITIPRTSSLKLSQVSAIGKYPVCGASGICGFRDDYQIEDRAVAIVKDGAGIGHAFLLDGCSSVLGTMQVIIPNSNVLPEYLFYLTKYLNLGKSFHGATIPHIYYKNYCRTKIRKHSVSSQKRIANILSNIDSVIKQKNNQMLALDELIKSRFILQEVA